MSIAQHQYLTQVLHEQESHQQHQHNHAQAEGQATLIIEDIVEVTWLNLKRNVYLNKHMQTFSCLRTRIINYQVDQMQFNSGVLIQPNEKEEAEPKALFVDSLMPISADIDPENPYKKSLSKRSVLEDSQVKIKAKEKEASAEKRNPYKKLQMTEASQEDGMTKELRRLNEEKSSKMDNDKKAKEKKQKIRLEKLKEQKNKKEEKFSYDYNGEVIQLKLENKLNLVSKVLNGLTNQQTKVVKEAIDDPHPTTLEGSKPGKKDKDKKFPMAVIIKKRDEVEFSDVKSLAQNIKTTSGVKYTYEGKTYEEKKRNITTLELKKTLHQRRISRDEFKKIKDLNGNIEDYDEKLKKSTVKENKTLKTQRSQSEAKLPESRATTKNKEKIHVNNGNLREKLLEKVNQPEYIQQSDEKEIESQLSTANKLGTIDNFNLEYIRTGGSLQVSTSQQFYSQRSNNQLPKIAHTTLYNKAMPKGRERLKDSNEILREMRKKFEEKLRL